VEGGKRSIAAASSGAQFSTHFTLFSCANKMIEQLMEMKEIHIYPRLVVFLMAVH
jgi:hypothetical protein